MAIVTGDGYLDLLSRFIEENTGPLLEETLLLKLNPVGLHYLQTRLESLEELEALLVDAPVDYLRAYIADLGDHRALEQLRRVLRLLGSVKVVAFVPAPARDPTRITLLPFTRLRSLELRGCDLSTSAARGLLELRHTLEKLVCHNSAEALRHIFAERTSEIQDTQVWTRLMNVSCFCNGMLLMDESLQLLPALEALDLSRNRFAKVANLHKCAKLKFFDAGFNRIATVASVHQVLPRMITQLVLRNNALVSTRGLERVSSLEALDLSYNLISNFSEVELLSELPSLRILWLEGNPLTYCRFYRQETLSFFSDPMKLTLDGKQTTKGESWAAKKIVALRLKQRSKYGAFTPAQMHESSTASLQWSDSGELSDTNSINDAGPSSGMSTSSFRTRKRNSRLASIEDSNGLQVTPRGVDPARETSVNSLGSFDSESAVRDSFVEGKGQIKETVLDLMQQAEALKRAGATSWLKDLNLLLEKEVKNISQIPDQARRKGSDSSLQILWERRRKKRMSRKGSTNVSDSMSRNSDGGNDSVEKDEAEGSLRRLTRESSLIRMRKEALARYKSDYMSNEDPVRYGNSSSFASMDGHQKSPDGGPADVVRDPDDEGDLSLREDSGSFRLTEELVTGRMFVSSAAPPQFNKDLLHRRQNLEKELLRVPPDQEFSPLSDSESSSGTVCSQLSESSESLHNSPSAIRHPFTLVHGFGDPGLLSPENFLQLDESGAPEEEAAEHSTDKSLEIHGDGEVKEAQETVGEGAASGSRGDLWTVGVLRPPKDNSAGDSSLPSQTKPKPSRRIVRLDSIPDSSMGVHGGSESRSLVSSPLEKSIQSGNIHQHSVSLDISSAAGQVLQRFLSSSLQFSHPSDITRNPSNDGDRSDWLENGGQDDSPSNALQRSKSHESSDGSLQCHRVHPVVGPFVGQCA